jgi:surface antigen
MSLYKARVMAHRGGGIRPGMTVARYGGMSCVPYARMATGISVSGNAWQWWDNAAGTYARGKMPEAGSILSFRSNHSMRMGHVAVVSRVVNARQVLIDHANWPTSGGRGGVARGVTVVDVSESNDWSAVRVQLGRGEDFGSVYPTHGFIYDRPDSGYMRTAVAVPAPQPALNPAPRDLRPASERMWSSYDEVAEAPMSYGRARTTYATNAASAHTAQAKQRNTVRRP